MTNHCGTCTACCRVFDIPELKKPAGTWCQHCAIGKGCKVYDDRPQMCREFECLWLMSQKRPDPREHMKPGMRPDKCKVVFSPSTNDRVMAATTMPGAPLAWQSPAVSKLIKRMIDGGDMAVVAGAPRSTTRTMIDSDGMHEVRMTEPDENGMQYNIEEQQS